jgi:hypothetical protein
MPITQAQIDYIANSALDFYLNRGTAFPQTLQERPMVAALDSAKAKMFPGGKDAISVAIKGAYGAGGVNDSLKGFDYDDTVEFYNPSNGERLSYLWREHHIGLTVTHSELKRDGIVVTNEMGATSDNAGRDKTVLINMWNDKTEDFGERYARSLNGLLWGDGTGDAKALHGIRHFIVADPSIGTVGGRNRALAANAFMRNRARTAAFGIKVAATPALAAHGGGVIASGTLIATLQSEFRQLRRYGGRPDMIFAGSDWIAAYEAEIRAAGSYTQTGFRGSQDGAMGGILFDGVKVHYDPTLDDLGFTKRAYIFDGRHIYIMKMQGDWRRTHNPARPVDKFVLYRSVTSTGQLVAHQLNSAGVYDVA